MVGSDYFYVTSMRILHLKSDGMRFVYGNHFSFRELVYKYCWFCLFITIFQYLNKFIFMRFSKVVSMVFADNTHNKMQSSTLAFAGTKINLTKKSCHLLE